MESYLIEAILSVKDRMTGVMDKVAKQVSNVTSKMTGMSEKTADTVLKTSAVVGTSMAAIGAAAIKSAGEMNAMNAQFSQTFGKLENKANAVVSSMGKEFNMLPSRIKPSFSKTTAMFKGLGMNTEEAMKKAESATRMTADAAAFYDLSFEDASSALTSFIKGNYEGGEAIGLFANETQMAAFAVEKGIVKDAKAWSALDEKTKQATRLEYAQKMQKMANVTGQAAREANGYENVMGNLKASLKEMLAALAQPFFDSFINSTKLATEALGRFTNFMKENPEIMKAVIAAFVAGGGALTAFALKAKLAANGISIFSKVIALVSSPVTLTVTAIGALVGAFVYLYNTNEKVRNAVQSAWEIIKNAIGTAITFISNFIQTLWKPVAEWFQANQEAIKATIQQVWTTVSSYVSSAVQAVSNVISTVFKSCMDWLVQNQNLIKSTFNVVWNAIKNIVTPIIQAISNVISTVFSTISNFIKQNQGTIKAIIKGTWDTIKTIVTQGTKVIQGIITTVMAFISGDWDKAWEGIKKITSGVWAIIKKLATTGMDVIKNTIKVGLNLIKSVWNMIWNSIKAIFSGIWNMIKQIGKTAMDALLNTIKGILEMIKRAWHTGWNNIKNLASNILNSIVNIFKRGVNSVVGVGRDIVTGLWNGIASGWNWLTSKVSNLASNLLKSAKRALKIHSPSRVFRDDVGYWITRGIGVGMMSEQNWLAKQSDKLANAAIPNVNSNIFSPDFQGVNSSFNSSVDHAVRIEKAEKQMAHIEVNIGGKKWGDFVQEISNYQGATGQLNNMYNLGGI